MESKDSERQIFDNVEDSYKQMNVMEQKMESCFSEFNIKSKPQLADDMYACSSLASMISAMRKGNPFDPSGIKEDFKACKQVPSDLKAHLSSKCSIQTEMFKRSVEDYNQKSKLASEYADFKKENGMKFKQTDNSLLTNNEQDSHHVNPGLRGSDHQNDESSFIEESGIDLSGLAVEAPLELAA